MYLLDTNVVSELRNARPHGAVVAWVKDIPDRDLHISAVTLGEIQAGIEITREQDPTKATEIEAWLDRLPSVWNVLPMDAAIFRAWGKLMHGRSSTLTEDAMIAATAIVHQLTIATRNVRDFGQFNVRLVNPFAMPRSTR